MAGPDERLIREILDIKRRLDNLETQAIRIPFLDNDPSVDEPANFWAFGDQRLRMRMPDDSIAEYRPYDQPYVPTLSADPATGTGISIWLTTGGELRVRLANGTVQRFAPIAATTSGTSGGSSGTTTKAKPVAVQPKTYVKPWAASWAASYRQNGTKRTENKHLYFGRIESYNGVQRSLFGFPADVQTVLAGATVKKVELFLYNLHAYYNAGVDIGVWGHGYSAEPSSSPGIGAAIGTYRYGNPDGHWVTLPLSVGSKLAAGTYRGFTLYKNSTSPAYYGYARGVNDGGTPPTLRITYVK